MDGGIDLLLRFSFGYLREKSFIYICDGLGDCISCEPFLLLLRNPWVMMMIGEIGQRMNHDFIDWRCWEWVCGLFFGLGLIPHMFCYIFSFTQGPFFGNENRIYISIPLILKSRTPFPNGFWVCLFSD